MNPNQLPGTPTPGSTSLPPVTPPVRPVSDIPEDGFGFVDEPTALPTVQPIAPQIPPQSYAPRPAPVLTPPARPLTPATTPLAAPAPAQTIAPPPPLQQMQITPPMPVVQPIPPGPQPIAPAPQPQPAPVNPVVPPVPSSMMPPQQIPAVPTAATAIDTTKPFNPAAVPTHASSTSENPITASYTPQNSTNHLPTDIAQRINEKPMQNSGDILRQIKHGLNGSRIKSILSFILFTASIFLAAFLINQFVFQSYYVEGTSMTPTLQNNDRLIISKVERTIAGIQGHAYIPERGQIVVLDSSIIGLNGQHEQLIKRVIGLPGDRVRIEAGTVTIFNTQHQDGYDVTRDLGLTNLLPTYTDTPIDITVPENQVYVMGDNREQGGSYDSRSFGPIDGNQIQGRLWGRVLPLESAQLY